MGRSHHAATESVDSQGWVGFGRRQLPKQRRAALGLLLPRRRAVAGATLRLWVRGNDPSAGSPTETLLRLHLPLDGKV